MVRDQKIPTLQESSQYDELGLLCGRNKLRVVKDAFQNTKSTSLPRGSRNEHPDILVIMKPQCMVQNVLQV